VAIAREGNGVYDEIISITLLIILYFCFGGLYFDLGLDFGLNFCVGFGVDFGFRFDLSLNLSIVISMVKYILERPRMIYYVGVLDNNYLERRWL